MQKPNIYKEVERTFERAVWVGHTMDRIIEADRIRDEEGKANIEKWIEGAREFIAGGNGSTQSNLSSVLIGEESSFINNSGHPSD